MSEGREFHCKEEWGIKLNGLGKAARRKAESLAVGKVCEAIIYSTLVLTEMNFNSSGSQKGGL